MIWIIFLLSLHHQISWHPIQILGKEDILSELFDFFKTRKWYYAVNWILGIQYLFLQYRISLPKCKIKLQVFVSSGQIPNNKQIIRSYLHLLFWRVNSDINNMQKLRRHHIWLPELEVHQYGFRLEINEKG